MTGVGAIGRLWMPSLVTVISGIDITVAVDALRHGGRWWWWAALVAGIICAVLAAVWAAYIQKKATKDGRVGIKQSASRRAKNYNITADRGGVAAVNIKGAVKTSPVSSSPENRL
jgi:hypothetical protein